VLGSAKLVEKNRLQLSCAVEEWLDVALAYPNVQLLDLILPIVVQSTRLEGFHNDPTEAGIFPNRECDRIAQSLSNRYEYSSEFANQIVEDARQREWD